ncbi:MAG TPA: hemerythrin domain-containing protein [Candidatus Binatia bacterium]|nr:hemerythrin domain-containing protein [Candidatus Binatia bacterium]
MNIVELLKDDHRIVETLFETYGEDPRRADAPAILRQIAEDLTLHTEAEERILYPEARASLEDGEDRVTEAIAEHAKVTRLIQELESRTGTGDDVAEKVAQLKAAVEHHVEEEEGELFPALEEALDEEKLEQMGQAMMNKKRENTGSNPSPRRESKSKDRTHARGSSAGGRRRAHKNADSRRRKGQVVP